MCACAWARPQFYFYAEDDAGGLFMVELSIQARRLSAMVKAPNQAQGAVFSRLLKDCLQPLVAQP